MQVLKLYTFVSVNSYAYVALDSVSVLVYDSSFTNKFIFMLFTVLVIIAYSDNLLLTRVSSQSQQWQVISQYTQLYSHEETVLSWWYN